MFTSTVGIIRTDDSKKFVLLFVVITLHVFPWAAILVVRLLCIVYTLSYSWLLTNFQTVYMASKRKSLCIDETVLLIRAMEAGEKISDVEDALDSVRYLPIDSIYFFTHTCTNTC